MLLFVEFGLLERRLDDSNYESLTQSIKRKEKNMNDVLITDAATVDTENDTGSDTDIDNNNDILISKVTWNEHGLQSTYGDMNGLQQIN